MKIRGAPNPVALYPFFCDHCEEAVRGEDCEAARGEGDEATPEKDLATGEGLKLPEKETNRRK